MKKNVASQKWRVVAYTISTSVQLAGDAANITAKISKDGGAYNATNDVNPTEAESGYYEFDLTQAETNADNIKIIPVSATGGVNVIGDPPQENTTTQYFSDFSLDSSGRVDLVDVPNSTAITAIQDGLALAATFTGITLLANWLRAGFRKDAADATALTEINTGGGAYSETTESQEATRDRGDAAWTTGAGTVNLNMEVESTRSSC